MNPELTDITLVVDRSGSMSSIRSDAEGGVNEFIKSQAKLPGEATLSLIQFDTEYQFVHRGVPIDKVRPYKLKPRGATALLDAVGRAINDAGARLARMNPDDRPGLVVFVIMTDGMENSSVEFTKSKIKDMIEHQESKYNWQFVFLGADQDVFAEAESIGIGACSASLFRKEAVMSAMRCTGNVVGRMRGQAKARRKVDAKFTQEERERMQ